MPQDKFPKSDTELTKAELNLPEAQPLPPSADGSISREDALSNAFLYSATQVTTALQSHPDSGLSENEIKKRLEEFGPNQLDGGDEISRLKILIAQVANAMTLGELQRCGMS